MRISRFIFALAVGMTLAAGSGRAAPWQQDTLNVQLLRPDLQTVAFNGNFKVPAANILILSDPLFPLSIGATTVTFDFLGSADLARLPFGLIKVTDLTNSPILNVQINPASTIGLLGSLISGPNFLQFNVQDMVINGASRLVLDVAFTSGSDPTPVPSPASLPLFVSGLLGFAVVHRAVKNRPG